MKFAVLLLVAAVATFASSAVVVDNVKALNEILDKNDDAVYTYDNVKYVVDNTDDDDDDGDVDGDDHIDEDTVIDGIQVKYLTLDEVHELLDVDDNIVMSEIDITLAKKALSERKSKKGNKGERKRRVGGLIVRGLFRAARGLFRGSRAGRVTTSGSRVTRQYDRAGSYGDAVRDFNRFNPSNRGSFSGRVNGQTGTVGRHRITVRDGSSSGRPTLEIRSPRGNGEYVRKFRYDRPNQ